MAAFTKGFVVIKVGKGEGSPKQVSRVFHARQAAVDFCELAKKGDGESKYFVTDKVGYDKDKGEIK